MAEAVKFSPGNGSGSASPLSELGRIVEELERKGGSVDEYAEPIAEQMVEAVLERFELESGFMQGPWPPSDFSHRSRQAENNKLLRDTGVMFGSITPWADGNVAEAFTNVPYAKFHVSHEPREVIPLRDFFDISIDAIAEYACEIILSGVLEGGGA